METTTSQRGVLNPEEAARHFRLTRYAPSPDLAHLVERGEHRELDATRARVT